MKKFVVKRVLLSIVILFFVSMIIYAIMRCMPSSFVEQQALTLSQRPGAKSYDEWVAQLNASYGLDTGVIQGYFRWAAKAIRGQFGDSWYFNQPVLTKFASVCTVTGIFCSGDHHRNSGRYCRCEKAVFCNRLYNHRYCTGRYFSSELFRCNTFKMGLFRKAWLVRPLRYCRT